MSYRLGGIGGGALAATGGAAAGIGGAALGRGGMAGVGALPLTALAVGRGGGVISGGGRSGVGLFTSEGSKGGGGGGDSVGAGPCDWEGRGGMGTGGPSSPHTLLLGAGTGWSCPGAELAGRDGGGGGGAPLNGTLGAAAA